MVEWSQRRDCDRYGLSLKPTSAILLCPWERHLRHFSLLGVIDKATLNFSHIPVRFQADSNILASLETSRRIAYLSVSASVAFLRDKMINIEIK